MRKKLEISVGPKHGGSRSEKEYNLQHIGPMTHRTNTMNPADQRLYFIEPET